MLHRAEQKPSHALETSNHRLGALLALACLMQGITKMYPSMPFPIWRGWAKHEALASALACPKRQRERQAGVSHLCRDAGSTAQDSRHIRRTSGLQSTPRGRSHQPQPLGTNLEVGRMHNLPATGPNFPRAQVGHQVAAVPPTPPTAAGSRAPGGPGSSRREPSSRRHRCACG